MIGYGELIIILCIILLLFGGKKLPEFARSLGKGIREFKKACHEIEIEEITDSSAKNETHKSSDELNPKI